MTDDPSHVYVVEDQRLPMSIEDARDMVVAWRVNNETSEE